MATHKSSFNRLAGVLLVALIIVALLFITASDNKQTTSTHEALVSDPVVITTEDVVNGQYYGKSGNSTWAGDKLTWVAKNGDLVSYDPKTGFKSVVVKATQFITRPWKNRFSRDGDRVLVSFSPQRVFRSTILARYAVHDSRTGELVQEIKTSDHGNEGQAFQLGVWSNDGNVVFLVYKNDLYAFNINSRSYTRLSFDGSDAVFNGIADWVFEEEIFVTTSTCVYSSKSGAYVGYLKFNDTVVEPVSYNLYGDYSSEPYFDEYYQYPKFGSVRYPKTGRRNPTVSVHVVNIGDPTCWTSPSTSSCAWEFQLNSLVRALTQINDNFIIGQFDWHDNDEKFTMLVFNRIQNTNWIIGCSVKTRECKVIRSSNQVNGWIDNNKLLRYKQEYVTLATVPQADKLEYMHVVGYTPDVVRMHTRGHFSVDEIISVSVIGGKDVIIFKSPLLSVDKRSSFVYTLDPSQSHYYALVIGGNSLPVCISCYSDCEYNTAKFSGVYFVNTCERSRGVSNVDLVTIRDDLSTHVIAKLEDNSHLSLLLSDVALPEVEYLTIPYSLNGNNYNLSVKIVGPSGWKTLPKNSIPVVVDTYSGPNSQKVTKRFTPNDWSYALASKRDNPVVYVTIDGVGSGRQSSTMAFEVYRNLGDKEIHDKVYALTYLLKRFRSLDPRRTLIWGWSYGGYVSAMMMGKDTERVFKCGISVAPVTNWYYYDTMYTERYMSTPEDNPTGYNASNVLRYAQNFKDKRFLLVHGNADDNVHYQQSMVLARALEQSSILFRMQSYPDENHSLGGVRMHLFKTLDDFLSNGCFK